MVFTDNLAFGLFAICIAGLMVLYSTISTYISYRKYQKSLSDSVKSTALPLLFLGIYLLVEGLWGEFVWPLPWSYNILFYDPMISFGIVLLVFALTSRSGGNMEYPGFLALLFGAMLIIYGVAGYQAGLTLAPLALLGMYVMYGLAGIFAYPVTFMLQRKPVPQKDQFGTWTILFILFCLCLFVGSCIAGYIGYEAIFAHLLSPP